MFSTQLLEAAEALLAACRAHGLKIATAESCTGGLVASALTEIAGSSDVVDRGFITYSNEAKTEMLGVSAAIIDRHGAVSAAVVLAMVEGALIRSNADIAVAITGIAGPGGGTPQKPVGLVYIAAHRKGREPVAHRFNFSDASRTDIRRSSVSEALRIALEAIQ